MNKKQLNKNTEILQSILNFVESESGYTISGTSREYNIPFLRAIYSQLCKEFTFASNREIGEMINRDHSTISYYNKTLSNEALTYPKMFVIYDKYKKINDKNYKYSDSDFVLLTKNNGLLENEVKFLRNQIKTLNTDLTDNEIKYRTLPEQQKKTYDIRAKATLDSFKWIEQNNECKVYNGS